MKLEINSRNPSDGGDGHTTQCSGKSTLRSGQSTAGAFLAELRCEEDDIKSSGARGGPGLMYERRGVVKLFDDDLVMILRSLINVKSGFPNVTSVEATKLAARLLQHALEENDGT